MFWDSAKCPRTLQISFTSDLESWIIANAKSPLKAESKDYPWCTFFSVWILNLWLKRKRKVFKQQAMNPSLLTTVEMQVKEYFYCVKGFGDKRRRTPKEVRCMKPTVGWFKLNTDGSMVGDSDVARCGGLLRDSNSLLIMGFAKPIFAFSSLAVEFFALREGLALCVELQAQVVEVELVASAAISLISSNITTNGDLLVLVDDCREFLLQLP